MIVTGSESASCGLRQRSGLPWSRKFPRTDIAEGRPASSAQCHRAAPASPQQISAGEQSFIMATSSAGAWRA